MPDGTLHLLPFEALQNEAGTYLVQQAAVSVAPSATVLAALRREPAKIAFREFLGVAFSAPPDNEAAKPGDRTLSDLRGGDIKPLKFAHEEVDKAETALGGDSHILEGIHASEAELKEQPLSEYKVIHLAAHGFGDEADPNRAAIVLSPGSPLARRIVASTRDSQKAFECRDCCSFRSAGEMVAAFAAENNLATLVGSETAGRLIPGSGSKVGDGYMLIMPRAEYITWGGERFEGHGVKPILKPTATANDSDSDPVLHSARASFVNAMVR